ESAERSCQCGLNQSVACLKSFAPGVENFCCARVLFERLTIVDERGRNGSRSRVPGFGVLDCRVKMRAPRQRGSVLMQEVPPAHATGNGHRVNPPRRQGVSVAFAKGSERLTRGRLPRGVQETNLAARVAHQRDEVAA